LSLKTAAFRFALLLALVLSGCAALDLGDTKLTDGPATGPDPEVPYFPSTDEAVLGMLKLAGTGPNDVVYDLGCGDGRIVIAAAKEFGARGVGVEIDPAPLRMAVYQARRAGVEDRVRFVRGDLFEAEIGDATVVTLFLFESLNRRLLPKLKKDLKPGTRIVAHRYGFGDDWPPEKTVQVGASTLYLWTVPDARTARAASP
jgi:SAM-dependent methyltransferase